MAKSLDKLGRWTVKEFFARFPDDEACLTHIMEVRYGLHGTCRKCENETTFHRLSSRRAFSCAHCGDHVYPTAGTIFQDTRTPLQVWFYAIYLFVTTRHGVSGKELERTLGVTYKTAYRMGMQIRKLMAKADGFEMLQGHIELDETYVGGRARGGKTGRGAPNKTIVFGLKERGGRMIAHTVPNFKTHTLRNSVLQKVAPGSTVSTDELANYNLLSRDGFKHGVVKHGQEEWVRGEHHTNSVESFWRLFKQSVKSTHIRVSSKYMDVYLREFTFRSNHRAMTNAMFDLVIAAV